MAFPAVRSLLRRHRHEGATSGSGVNSSLDGKDGVVLKKKRKKKERLTEAYVLLKASLNMLNASADAFPPLRCVAGVLLHIIDVLEVKSSNEKGLQQTLCDVQKLGDLLQLHLPRLMDNPGLLDAIHALKQKLEDINGEIEKLPGKSQLKLFLTAFKTKERLVDIRNKLHVAVDRFELALALCTQANIIRIESIAVNTESIAVNTERAVIDLRKETRNRDYEWQKITTLAIVVAFN